MVYSTYPPEKYESQLGWWHSQYVENFKKNVPNHQPDNHSGWKIMEYSHLLMGIVGIHLDKISKTFKDVSKMFGKKTGQSIKNGQKWICQTFAPFQRKPGDWANDLWSTQCGFDQWATPKTQRVGRFILTIPDEPTVLPAWHEVWEELKPELCMLLQPPLAALLTLLTLLLLHGFRDSLWYRYNACS